MLTRYILDGSNLAHDGGSAPSFDRLMDAARSLATRNEGSAVTICIDANLLNNPKSEDRGDFSRASVDRRLYPAPAGTAGGGDTWVMAVANLSRSGGETAVIVSNDSFAALQESNPWIFDSGSLLGGHSVDDLGWAWVERFPIKKEQKRVSRGAKPLKQVEVEFHPPTANVPTDDESDETREIPVETESNTGGLESVDLAKLPPAGSIVEAKVVGYPGKDYGVFVLAEGQFAGRVTNTYFAEDDAKKRGSQVYSIGDVVYASVVSVLTDGKLKLSIRDALSAPTWEALPDQIHIYGMKLDFDEFGNYVPPEGLIPDTNAWIEGYEDKKEAWEASWNEASSRWSGHVRWLDANGLIDKELYPDYFDDIQD